MMDTYKWSVILCACLLSACSSSSDNNNTEPVLNDPDQIPRTLLGLWERPGYGEIFDIAREGSDSYEINSASCAKSDSFDGITGVATADLDLITVEPIEAGFSKVTLPGDLFPMLLKPLDALPAACSETVDESTQAQFDKIWTDFNDYYAFFDLRNVDWNLQYAQVSPQIADLASDSDAFFGVLVNLLTPIDDRHVGLFSEDLDFSPATERGVFGMLVAEFEAQSEVTDEELFIDEKINQFNMTILNRLDEGSIDDQGEITWGTIDGSIGYINIERMEGFAEGADDDTDPSVNEPEAAGRAIDAALNELQDMQGIIVDVRANVGGSDEVSIEIASRFNDVQRIAFSKTASIGGVSIPAVEAELPAVANPYLKPIVLMTGRDTRSAAEIFAMAMSLLAQVTTLGQPTSGALSDELSKTLPNGWGYILSNEVYLDTNGESFEAVGVPVDVLVSSLTLEDIDARSDPILEAAINTLKGQ